MKLSSKISTTLYALVNFDNKWLLRLDDEYEPPAPYLGSSIRELLEHISRVDEITIEQVIEEMKPKGRYAGYRVTEVQLGFHKIVDELSTLVKNHQ